MGSLAVVRHLNPTDEMVLEKTDLGAVTFIPTMNNETTLFSFVEKPHGKPGLTFPLIINGVLFLLLSIRGWYQGDL